MNVNLNFCDFNEKIKGMMEQAKIYKQEMKES